MVAELREQFNAALFVLGLFLVFIGVFMLLIGILIQGVSSGQGLGIIIIGPLPIIIKSDPTTTLGISIILLIVFISLIIYLMRKFSAENPTEASIDHV